jgi:hypothetical protein
MLSHQETHSPAYHSSAMHCCGKSWASHHPDRFGKLMQESECPPRRAPEEHAFDLPSVGPFGEEGLHRARDIVETGLLFI